MSKAPTTNFPCADAVPLPWSKQHKQVTKAAAGGLTYSLSNSFAQPLTSRELLDLTRQRGDHELVEKYLDHSLEYTPNGGSADLRAEIANQYGPDITAANVLVFPGAQVALQTVARALVGRHSDGGKGGGHAITFTPGYQSVVQGPAHVGSHVTSIPLHAAEKWQIDVAKVEEAMREDTRYIVINEPYNPAGTLMSKEAQGSLVKMARRRDVHILCDEVYRLLEHNVEDRLPAMADFYDRGISVVTLSKPWGACGVTIGWVATQDLDLLERISDAQYFGTACPSRASELQAIMVLRSSDQILRRNIDIILRNKALLSSFMHRFSDLFCWVPPCAGAIAAIKFKGPLSSTDLGSELAEQGISIKPAYCFTDDVKEENDYFRVGFGEDSMPVSLEAFAQFVEERKEMWRDSM